MRHPYANAHVLRLPGICLPAYRMLLLLTLLLLPAARLLAAPDLGVRYISRGPLYWRYNVQYNNGVPYLASTHNGLDPALDKHWPAPGEAVTFIAHIRNHGSTAAAGFQYQWAIDGVTSGPIGSYPLQVPAGGEATVSFNWTWPADLNDHTIRIVVDPAGILPDPYRQNNTYEDHTNALSLSIWVEQGLYQRFNARQNGFGTYSFDDWFRWQFDAWRAAFARSIYPGTAPNGVLERVRVEEINVIPFDPNNLNNWMAVLDADPHQLLNDGRWQFTSDKQTLAEKQTDWDNYVNFAITTIDGGLLHEMNHQLGVIDMYRMNLEVDANHVLLLDGTPLGTRHIFYPEGLMAGPTPYTGDVYLEEHTAGYLNRNLHYRRGYFGEYLYDLPSSIAFRALDIYGAPLPGATVEVFQKGLDEILPNTPFFTGTTDSAGKILLPNRTAPAVTTATGHTLHNNPFGAVNVVGVNGTFLVRFSLPGQEDYRWFEIQVANVGYWKGATGAAVYDFRTWLVPGTFRFGANIAQGRPATASSNPSTAGHANDGDKLNVTDTWEPSPTSAGQWWQVDLGTVQMLHRVGVWSFAGNWHDWYSAFHFEASTTGAFSGEQTVIPAETDWDGRRYSGFYGMQFLSGLVDHCVYAFPPVSARYLRIVSDQAQNWVQLQEVEVYPLLAATPAIASVTVTPSTVPGSKSAQGKVTLAAPAPAGGVKVPISSTNPAAHPDTWATVSAGQTISLPFTIGTEAVVSTVTGKIFAGTGATQKSTSITVRPIGVKSLAFSPSSVVGGNSSVGVVTLEAKAAPGNITVTFSSNSLVSMPVTLTISAGKTSASFVARTSPVTAKTAVSIQASANGITKSATLTLNPVLVQSVTLIPSTVSVGENVIGIVTLNSAAPAGGVLVSLGSANAALANPSVGSILIPAGATFGTFNVDTFGVSGGTPVAIRATLNGTTKSGNLTVTP